MSVAILTFLLKFLLWIVFILIKGVSISTCKATKLFSLNIFNALTLVKVIFIVKIFYCSIIVFMALISSYLTWITSFLMTSSISFPLILFSIKLLVIDFSEFILSRFSFYDLLLIIYKIKMILHTSNSSINILKTWINFIFIRFKIILFKSQLILLLLNHFSLFKCILMFGLLLHSRL